MIVVVIFALVHEIDELHELFIRFHESSFHLEKKYKFYVSLGANDTLVDWDNSILTKDFFIKKFDQLTKLTGWAPGSTFQIRDDICGAASNRRLAHQECQDASHFIWVDPDIIFDRFTLKYIEGSIDALEKNRVDTRYIITPEIVRYWDTTWDVIVNEKYKNHPLNYCRSNSAYEDAGTKGQINLEKINEVKFGAGWITCMSKSILDLFPVPVEFPYGPDDTSIMIRMNRMKLYNQYVMRNCVVCENYTLRTNNYYGRFVKIIDNKNKNRELGNKYIQTLIETTNLENRELDQAYSEIIKTNKSLIYSCVFFNEKYIDLINLTLKTYKLFGNSSDDIDYLIICNPEFKKSIQDIFDNLNINGKLWCLDVKTIFEAGYSRLKIFDYPNINLYNKILYLDCDILITNSINKVLDFKLNNKLYVLKEGNTNHVYWGGPLFFENNLNIDAFTSGILLFNNNVILKNLFSIILEHIDSHINRNLPIPECLDQPFIVYHSIKNDLYDNQKLINLVINNPKEFNGETICHFPGVPGHYESKIEKMNNFMNDVIFKLNKNQKDDFEVILGCKYDKKLIPKIIMQTAKDKPERYIIDIINNKCPGWKYIHFVDSEIIQYFKENPNKEFPNIIEKFNSFSKGQHKADLFRYYYLYLNGGIFMDSDAIFEVNIDYTISSYDGVFVKSFMPNTHLFNGFIATYPKNPIIYDALKHAYETEDIILQEHYHYFCEELWRIYNKHNPINTKIYQECNKHHEGYGGSVILDDNGVKIISHYWKSKKIPKSILTHWCYSKKIPDIENKKHVFIHNYKKDGKQIDNIGDIYSSIYKIIPNYVENYDVMCLNSDVQINDNTKEKLKDKIAIIGGGGLIDLKNEWNNKINFIIEHSKKTYFLGPGYNDENSKSNTALTKINFQHKNVSDIGLRDINNEYRFIPCPSCLLLEKYPNKEVKREYGIVQHCQKKIPNIPNINDKISMIYENEKSIGNILDFISSTNKLIVNSYHAYYFGVLLGKKVILYNNWSSKFNNIFSEKIRCYDPKLPLNKQFDKLTTNKKDLPLYISKVKNFVNEIFSMRAI